MKDVVKTDVAQMIADAQKESLTNGRKNISKAIKNVAKDVNNESEETTMKDKMKDMFTKMAEKNPRLAKAIQTIKKGSIYLVKNYISAVFGVAVFPAIVVGVGLGVTLLKYKGGEYLTSKTAVYSALGVTAVVAVASVAVVIAAGAVKGLLVAAAVVTASCVAVDIWSWFKNRKTK